MRQVFARVGVVVALVGLLAVVALPQTVLAHDLDIVVYEPREEIFRNTAEHYLTTHERDGTVVCWYRDTTNRGYWTQPVREHYDVHGTPLGREDLVDEAFKYEHHTLLSVDRVWTGSPPC